MGHAAHYEAVPQYQVFWTGLEQGPTTFHVHADGMRLVGEVMAEGGVRSLKLHLRSGKLRVRNVIERDVEIMRKATNKTDSIVHNKGFIWVALATGFVLLVPLMAMRFTDEVAWTLLDFVTAGTLVFGTGLVFVMVARTMPKYRAITGIALAVALIYVWVELAVGIFTTWGS